MRSLSLLLAPIALCLILAACGSTEKQKGETAASTAALNASRGPFADDGDADNPGDIDGDEHADKDIDEDSRTPQSYRYHDPDDRAILHFGHAATADELRRIAAIVSRYYQATAAGDGLAACGLLEPKIAVSVPEVYAGDAGVPYLRGGKTCAQVMTKLFAHLRGQLTGSIQVTGVRIAGAEARALVGSRAMPASEIGVRREGGAWYIATLVGRKLP